MRLPRFALSCICIFGLSVGTARAEDPQIGHMVYFTLKSPTKENKDFFIAAAKKYLKDIDGMVYFSTGTRGEAFARDINDKDWEISLQMVFKNKAAHDKYSDHPQHQAFIKDCLDKVSKVRVFDTEIK